MEEKEVQEEIVDTEQSFVDSDDIIDNSKMFSHCWSTNGRIGRLEYGLPLLFSLILYAILLMGGHQIVEWIEPQSERTYRTMHIISMAIPILIMGLAAVKRIHDAGKSLEKYVASAISVSIPKPTIGI